MKNLLILFSLSFLAFSFTDPETGLTKAERKMAHKDLKQAKQDQHKLLKGLSKEQLMFKPDSTRWSVFECLQHITLAEGGLWGMFTESMKSNADPSKRSEVKVTDEAFIGMITNRTSKFPAAEPFWPTKSTYTKLDDLLDAYDAQRETIIQYVKDTKEDLRNHFVMMPFGTIDSYQLLLMIAAHNQRHMAQMREVMAHPNFPKS